MSARPFRVGDRVRISGWGSHGPHEGTVVRIDPADPDGGFGPYIATDCQYRTDRGELAIATCAMTSDLTAGSGCTVELIESADDGRVHDPVEAEGETRLMVGPCTCAGQADPECDCTGCIGRHIECRLTDPWSDTAEPEGEPADISEDDGPVRPVSSQAGLAGIRHGVVQRVDAVGTVVQILTDHYDLLWREDGRMYCTDDCGYSVDAEAATAYHLRRHQAALILAAIGGAS